MGAACVPQDSARMSTTEASQASVTNQSEATAPNADGVLAEFCAITSAEAAEAERFLEKAKGTHAYSTACTGCVYKESSDGVGRVL